jgi:hypothetical protein
MIAKSRTRQVSHLRYADRPSVEPPTPMELRRKCARIRSGWTESERSKRSVWKTCPWYAPVINTADLALAID